MEPSELRTLITWSDIYDRSWDDAPDMYVEHGLAAWGKSRRLGLLRVGQLKAYIGVQHIDPSLPGWAIVDEPEARYFVSVLVANRTTFLRTFPTMGETLDFLLTVLAPPC